RRPPPPRTSTGTRRSSPRRWPSWPRPAANELACETPALGVASRFRRNWGNQREGLVKRLSRGRWLAVATALAVVAVAAGCGSGGSGGTSSPGGSAPASSAAPSVKIGLVTDIGGLNDRSFNHLA